MSSLRSSAHYFVLTSSCFKSRVSGKVQSYGQRILSKLTIHELK